MQLLDRFTTLGRRYVNMRWRVTIEPGPMEEQGQIVGYLDAGSIVGGRLKLVGRSSADEIRISHGSGTRQTITTVRHDDVPVRRGQDAISSFEADLALAGLPIALHLHKDGKTKSITLPIHQRDLRLARARARWQFVKTVITGSPKWLVMVTRGQHAAVGRDVRRALATGNKLKKKPIPRALEPEALLEVTPGSIAEEAVGTVTIVMPVYNSLALVKTSLARITQNTVSPHRIVVIDDGSTDAAVRPWLRHWQGEQATHERLLIESDKHLGFAGATNRALERAISYGSHVVLLQPDTLVPPGWLARLIAPLGWTGKFASATPMSNDAGILSVPRIGVPTRMGEDQADSMDAVAARLNPYAAATTLPAGVGFCMALNIDALRSLPHFDAAIGEAAEIDWCLRARALGWKHVGLSNLFVERAGDRPSTLEEQRSPTRQQSRLIEEAYPAHLDDIGNFLERDPLFTPRLALSLAWLASTDAVVKKGCPIYFAHFMGGGAKLWLNKQIANDIQTSGGAVVVRVGGPTRFAIELHIMGATLRGTCDEFDLVARLLEPFERRRIIYSNAAGDPRPHELPAMITSLRQHARDTVTVLFHDFLPLSPSYTLLNSANEFVGVPKDDDPDSAHIWQNPDGTSISLALWRAAWRELLANADRLVAFSSDSAQHIVAAYPDLAPLVVVEPHRLDEALLSALFVGDVGKGNSRVFAALGSINFIKGGHILCDVVRKFEHESENKPTFVVLGKMDRRLPIPKSLHIHGLYQLSELPNLIREYGVTDFLVLSICPETFSFTTHEALATGLPVWTLPLGAQQEAAMRSPNGNVIPADPSRPLAESVFASIKSSLRHLE